ncbi:hypothetical protein B0H14DRAFT_2573757 [Mycena olivaceomarginata]|nr:hypothetical protein B0H14DRAFT_2573757 [Mycena olivaceomarginata]
MMRSEGACKYGVNQDVESERRSKGVGGEASSHVVYVEFVLVRGREVRAGKRRGGRVVGITTKGGTSVNSCFEYVVLVSSASVMVVDAVLELGNRGTKSRSRSAPTSLFSLLGILTTLHTTLPTASPAAHRVPPKSKEREEEHARNEHHALRPCLRLLGNEEVREHCNVAEVRAHVGQRDVWAQAAADGEHQENPKVAFANNC